jgi:hypothetical protein
LSVIENEVLDLRDIESVGVALLVDEGYVI